MCNTTKKCRNALPSVCSVQCTLCSLQWIKFGCWVFDRLIYGALLTHCSAVWSVQCSVCSLLVQCLVCNTVVQFLVCNTVVQFWLWKPVSSLHDAAYSSGVKWIIAGWVDLSGGFALTHCSLVHPLSATLQLAIMKYRWLLCVGKESSKIESKEQYFSRAYWNTVPSKMSIRWRAYFL